jgi:hypothetical protein
VNPELRAVCDHCVRVHIDVRPIPVKKLAQLDTEVGRNAGHIALRWHWLFIYSPGKGART